MSTSSPPGMNIDNWSAARPPQSDRAGPLTLRDDVFTNSPMYQPGDKRTTDGLRSERNDGFDNVFRDDRNRADGQPAATSTGPRTLFTFLRYNAGGFYFGTLSRDDLKSGVGVLSIPKSIFYEGEWLEDSFNGVGLVVRPGKPSYFGEFKNGAFEGYGRIVAKHHSFLGSFSSGVKSGVGETITRQGVKVFGNYYKSRLNDYGEISDVSSQVTLKGWFRGGKLHGKAVKSGPKGKFIARYKNGVREGQGGLFDAEGKLRMVGTYVNDQLSGFSKFVAEGTSFEGYFSGGHKEGLGRISSKGQVYLGYFVLGNRQGFGRGAGDGWEYTGNWFKDTFSGTGYLRFTEKHTTYFGSFKDGVKHGLGVLIEEGREYYGYFNMGSREGDAIIKVPGKGERYANFENDRLIDIIRTTTPEINKLIDSGRPDFRTFAEESSRLLKEISREISSQTQELNIDWEDIEKRVDGESEKLNEDYRKILMEFESLRDKFDVLRFNLGQKVGKSGLKYDNRFIYEEQEDQMKRFTLEFDAMGNEFGQPYGHLFGEEHLNKKLSQQHFIDSSWFSFDKEFCQLAGIEGNAGFLLAPVPIAIKKEEIYAVETPEAAFLKTVARITPPEQERALVRKNYQAFSNLRLYDFVANKLEDMGSAGYEEETGGPIMIPNLEILTSRHFDAESLITPDALPQGVLAPPEEVPMVDFTEMLNAIQGRGGGSGLQRYINMIEELRPESVLEDAISAGKVHKSPNQDERPVNFAGDDSIRIEEFMGGGKKPNPYAGSQSPLYFHDDPPSRITPNDSVSQQRKQGERFGSNNDPSGYVMGIDSKHPSRSSAMGTPAESFLMEEKARLERMKLELEVELLKEKLKKVEREKEIYEQTKQEPSSPIPFKYKADPLHLDMT